MSETAYDFVALLYSCRASRACCNSPPMTHRQKLVAFRGGGQQTPGSPERKPVKYKSVKDLSSTTQLNIKDLCV